MDESALESIGQKIIRHIRQREFDSHTLKRGVTLLKDAWETARIREASIGDPEVTRDYLGNPGLDVYKIRLVIPILHGNSLGQSQEKGRVKSNFITVFPEDTTLRPTLLSDYSREVIDAVKGFPEAIAGITGPTASSTYNYDEGRYSLHVSDNGYYMAGTGTVLPFRDTNPPGQRRGAIAFDASGQVSLLTDIQKWQAVNSNFEGITCLSGTSFYFTSEDPVFSKESLTALDSHKSQVSYLIQYTDTSGRKHLAHFISSTLLYRSVAKSIIDRFIKSVKAVSYIAVEMELNGSDTVIVPADKSAPVQLLREGFNRNDHYFVVKKDPVMQPQIQRIPENGR